VSADPVIADAVIILEALTERGITPRGCSSRIEDPDRRVTGAKPA